MNPTAVPPRRHVGNLAFSMTSLANEQELPAAPIPSRSRLALHNQDLVDVMLELERVKGREADCAFKMAKGGRVHALNELELKKLRNARGGVFNPSEWESPILSGSEELPFISPPTVAQTQRILKEDIGGENFFRFAPSRGSPEMDAQATMKLLDNIGNPTYREPGAVFHMVSPQFDRLRSRSPNWNADGFLGQSNFQMTIAPANEVFELEYYDHHLFSTLLTGSKVWLAFPPLHGNPDILRQVYEDMRFTLPNTIHVLRQLQHGIAIVQKPGQTLMIPAYWFVMVFCSETSTSCGFFIATALKFMDRVRYLEVWRAVNRLWPDKKQQQAHLVKYASEFASHLTQILKDSCKHFRATPIIAAICREWMRNTEDFNVPSRDKAVWPKTMKDKLVELCALIEDQAERARIEDTFQKAFIHLLEEKLKKNPECRLCRLHIDRMPGEGNRNQRLAQHFVDEHWARQM